MFVAVFGNRSTGSTIFLKSHLENKFLEPTFKIILPVKELNIFSGTNEVGESNFLKALILFFNNQTGFLKTVKFRR
ncbi:MAG: ATP-binding protein [Bacteroidetes bacterium]|nr:ATP-binding protein [Bacteroidota bacterium]